jgi:hypothetical protein
MSQDFFEEERRKPKKLNGKLQLRSCMLSGELELCGLHTNLMISQIEFLLVAIE